MQLRQGSPTSIGDDELLGHGSRAVQYALVIGFEPKNAQRK
jgi:hypothetical protein